jgi:hypothetical protein
MYASKSGLFAGAIIAKTSMAYLCKMLRCAIKRGASYQHGYSQYQSADGVALTFQSAPFRLIPYRYKRYSLYIQENGALSDIEHFGFFLKTYI